MIGRPVIAVTLLFLVFLCGREMYLYANSSSKDAERRAATIFWEDCPGLSNHCPDFAGPYFDGEWQGIYKFRWTDRSGRGLFFVEISYLPFRSNSWYVPEN